MDVANSWGILAAKGIEDNLRQLINQQYKNVGVPQKFQNLSLPRHI